jgi:hypothetical protein
MINRTRIAFTLAVLTCSPLALAKPKGRTQVELAVKPASAQLFIDDKAMGKAGDHRLIDITPGFHVIHLVNKGDEHEERVKFAPNQKTIYTFEFDEASLGADTSPSPVPDDDGMTRHRNEAGDDKP